MNKVSFSKRCWPWTMTSTSPPFPARHLLPLEQYPLFTPMGDLQTTVLTGQQFGADSIIPRNPALIIAELRSVAREYGIRHFVFSGPPLSADLNWLHDMLYHLATSDFGIHWEGSLDYLQLTPDLLRMCRRAGCEVLCFPLDAIEVVSSRAARAKLSAAVEQAHRMDIAVRAQIALDPSFAAMPTLVDLAATFGLDDVRLTSLNMPPSASAPWATISSSTTWPRSCNHATDQAEVASFIQRFRPRVGPMLWRVGRAGLLGRTWQRYADGGDDAGGAAGKRLLCVTFTFAS